RTPIADIADYERTSALRRNLDQLSSDAGAKLLQALGVNGDEAELRSASDEFRGHCLALTLLGSYLTDAYNGDIRRRSEVSGHLAHDVRQGAHARKVMESYQTWFDEGPELSVLRMLGLFDRIRMNGPKRAHRPDTHRNSIPAEPVQPVEPFVLARSVRPRLTVPAARRQRVGGFQCQRGCKARGRLASRVR